MTKNETARLAHKDYFDKCEIALDNGFYLEAMMLEYASIESRVNTIMRLLGMPCVMKENDKNGYDIGIVLKLTCLKKYLGKTKLFENSRLLPPSTITHIKDWCNKRNTRAHRYFVEINDYERNKENNKEYAKIGYEYSRIMYKEVDRIKKVLKKHPDYLDEIKCNAIKEPCVKVVNKSSQ